MKHALQTMWIRLTADPRRFGMLCACLGIGLLLWARLILVSDLPRMAIADDSAADPGSEMVDGDGGRDAIIAPEDATIVVLDERPLRDPFAVSEVIFPRPRISVETDAKNRKLGPATADEVTTDMLEDFKNEVPGRWSVDTVFVPGQAIVEGKRFGVGDQIANGPGGHPVVLAEVRQRSIVVRCGDAELILRMSGPDMGGN